METELEKLIDAVAGKPSEIAIRNVREMLDEWPDPTSFEKALRIAQDAFNSWPQPFTSIFIHTAGELEAERSRPSWPLISYLGISFDAFDENTVPLTDIEFAGLNGVPTSDKLEIKRWLPQIRTISIQPDQFSTDQLNKFLRSLPEFVSRIEVSHLENVSSWSEISSFLASRKQVSKLSIFYLSDECLRELSENVPEQLVEFVYFHSFPKNHLLLLCTEKSSLIDRIEEIRLLNQQWNSGDVNLLSQQSFSSLNTLQISACHLAGDDIGRLVESNFFHRLQSLDVAFNRLGCNGIRQLSRCQFKSLEELDLRQTECDDEGIAELLNADFSRKLRKLSVQNNREITDSGFDNLCPITGPALLESLDLSFTGIGDLGIQRLLDSGFLDSLQTLRLSYLKNSTNRTVKNLCSHSLAMRLSHFVYAGAEPLGGLELSAMSSAPAFQQLQHLELEVNGSDDNLNEGLAAVSQSTMAKSIRRLRIELQDNGTLDCLFGPKSNWPALRWLELVVPPNDKSMLRSILTNGPDSLWELNAADCSFDNELLALLMESKGFRQLRRLQVSLRDCDSENVGRFANSRFGSQLEKLAFDRMHADVWEGVQNLNPKLKECYDHYVLVWRDEDEERRDDEDG